LIGASFIGAPGAFRNQIDKLMTPFRKSNPEFYRGYLEARVIIDRRATHTARNKSAPGPSPLPVSQPTPSPA
jgi:hypothetical protein